MQKLVLELPFDYRQTFKPRMSKFVRVAMLAFFAAAVQSASILILVRILILVAIPIVDWEPNIHFSLHEKT